MSDIEERHPVSGEASHEVIEDEPVRLWKNGVFITVSSRDVGALQEQGWLTGSPADLPQLMAEVRLLAGQVVSNIEQFIAGVSEDGYIDAADGGVYAASLTARHLMDEKIADMLAVIHGAFPMRQAEAATTTHADEVISHDPSQMAVLDAEGGLRFIDPEEEPRLSELGWKKV